MSSWISRLVTPSQAVRTMNPPSAGARPRRCRAAGRARPGPRCAARCRCARAGMSTRWRPGSEMCGRDARALGADRLLGHLDEDLLALRQPLLDGREGARRRGARAVSSSASLAAGSSADGSATSGAIGSASTAATASGARRRRVEPAPRRPGAGGPRRGGTPPCRGRRRRTRPACRAARAPPCPCRCCRRCRGRDRARCGARQRGLVEDRDPGLPGRRVDDDLPGHALRAAASAAGSGAAAWKRVASLWTRRRGRASWGRSRRAPTTALGRSVPSEADRDLERQPRRSASPQAATSAAGASTMRSPRLPGLRTGIGWPSLEPRDRVGDSAGRAAVADRRRSTSQRKPAIACSMLGAARGISTTPSGSSPSGSSAPRRRAHLGGGPAAR